MEVVELLKELVRIPSQSGDERKIGEFLAARLKKNFEVKMQKVGDRFNILATRGTPDLLFTTHMDTVPKQIEVGDDEEFVYGRGSCDAKGSLACMMCACEEAVRKEMTDFGMLFDVGEEDDFAGILNAADLISPKMIVVGEPTDFKIAYGQNGLVQVKIACNGIPAPGSTPEKGVSAIMKLVEIIGEINLIELPESELGKTTFNVGKISGGSAANVVPDYAEAVVEFRTTVPNEIMLSKIKEVVPEECLKVAFEYEPVMSSAEGFDFLGLEKIVVPYFTEMYFWRKAKVIVVGPGSYEFAHSDRERIKKSDLIRGVEVYLELIRKFSKKK